MNDYYDLELGKGIIPWIIENNIVNEKGQPISFHEHLFMYEPYQDFSRRQVAMKCSQIGWSVMMAIKAVYAMKTFGWNIIYTLPSDNDVHEHVPTKVDRIYESNPAIKETLTSEKISVKQIDGSFIFFKGTRSKSAAIMTTADLLIHDELDRSDLSIIEMFGSRTKRSKYKGRWDLSNPSYTNLGVDVAWAMSDQKEWYVTCGSCNLSQVLDWYKNVSYDLGEYVCQQCGSVITDKMRNLGEWKARNPLSEVSGYHVSQMMAPWISCKELIIEEKQNSEEYFYNFILGLPVEVGDVENFRRLILDAWTPRSLRTPPYFMGVDIGSKKHYVLGNKDGIFKIGYVKTRLELEAIIDRYNPYVVMDAGPERTWAEEFKQKYPKLAICFYKRDKERKKLYEWGEKDKIGYVYVDRNRMLDQTVSDIIYADIQFDLESQYLEQYISHWESVTKRAEEDSLGGVRYVWAKNTEHAQDHYVHATNYYNVARTRVQKAIVDLPRENKNLDIVVPTADGMKMRSLEEIMNNRNL